MWKEKDSLSWVFHLNFTVAVSPLLWFFRYIIISSMKSLNNLFIPWPAWLHLIKYLESTRIIHAQEVWHGAAPSSSSNRFCKLLKILSTQFYKCLQNFGKLYIWCYRKKYDKSLTTNYWVLPIVYQKIQTAIQVSHWLYSVSVENT